MRREAREAIVSTIRELREAAGLTQLELAVRVRVTPSTVYNWESGRAIPGVLQLRAVAREFKVSSDDIQLVEPEGDAKKLAA